MTETCGDDEAVHLLTHALTTAAVINLGRLGAWFRACPRAATRTSRFATLAA